MKKYQPNDDGVATKNTYSVTNAVLGGWYAVTLSQDAGFYTTYMATSSLIVGCILSIASGSGNWEDPATWNLNRAPLITDNAVIDDNHYHHH